MEKIERPKKVSKLDKQILSKKNFEENADNQFNKIYDKLDELVEQSNIPEEDDIFSEVLWENKSPTAEFKAQTINLKENNYKYFRIFFRLGTSSNRIDSIVIRPGDSFETSYTDWFTPSGVGYIGHYYRSYCSSSQKTITFSDCRNIKNNSTTINIDNTDVIPVQVVGFN